MRRLAFDTLDLVTIALLGVAIAVLFWMWDQLYHLISALATLAFPPSAGLFGGVWLLGGIIGALVVRKPGAALLTEMVASSLEALLGNGWGFSNVVSGLVQGLGVEVVFALFFYKRFGLAIAAFAGVMAALGESLYEWAVYYPDWGLPYKISHLGFFAFSGVVVAGGGGWFLVRALRSRGALDHLHAGHDDAG